MKPSELPPFLSACWAAGQVPMILGAPGIAKTEIIHQESKAYGWTVDVRGAGEDPVEVGGFPFPDLVEKRVHRSPPWFWPGQNGRTGPGTIFLDEFGQTPQSVQPMFLQLLRERRIGEHTLPPDVRLVAASNRVAHRAGTHRLITPIKTRVITTDLEVDVDDWSAWALQSGRVLHPVIYWVRFAPDVLREFEPDADTWSNPRTIEMASDLLRPNPPESLQLALLTGAIGRSAGSLMSFLDVWRHMPSIDGIFMDPTGSPVPPADKPGARLAVCGGIAARVGVNSLEAAVAYLERFKAHDGRQQRELGEAMMKDALRRDPTLAHTPAGVRYAVKSHDLHV